MASPRDSSKDDPDLFCVLGDDGRTDPATDPFLSTEVLVAIYRDMRRARALDRALVEAQREGLVAYHVSAEGQEAVPVAVAAAIEPTDWVFPARRESALLLARGFPLERYLAHAFGKAGDVAKGRQMPGHPSSREFSVVSPSGIVGASLPQAVGAALAVRRSGGRSVTVAFIGEGGTSTPDFHSAMNFAGVFGAPCLIIVQNNQWALSTPAARQTASASFAVKGKAYGVPAVRVDGNDALAVFRAVSDARIRAVAGGGPTLLECVTDRRAVEPAAGGEGPLPENVTDAGGPPSRDPIERFRRHLAYLGVLGGSEDAFEVRVAEEIGTALSAARAAPPPDRETLFDDVYAERPWHLAEQAIRSAT